MFGSVFSTSLSADPKDLHHPMSPWHHGPAERFSHAGSTVAIQHLLHLSGYSRQRKRCDSVDPMRDRLSLDVDPGRSPMWVEDHADLCGKNAWTRFRSGIGRFRNANNASICASASGRNSKGKSNASEIVSRVKSSAWAQTSSDHNHVSTTRGFANARTLSSSTSPPSCGTAPPSHLPQPLAQVLTIGIQTLPTGEFITDRHDLHDLHHATPHTFGELQPEKETCAPQQPPVATPYQKEQSLFAPSSTGCPSTNRPPLPRQRSLRRLQCQIIRLFAQPIAIHLRIQPQWVVEALHVCVKTLA